MARIVIVINDATGPSGEEGINVEIESAEPHFPIAFDEHLGRETIDPERATKSQLIAFGAIMEMAGLGNAELLIRPPDDETPIAQHSES